MEINKQLSVKNKMYMSLVLSQCLYAYGETQKVYYVHRYTGLFLLILADKQATRYSLCAVSVLQTYSH